MFRRKSQYLTAWQRKQKAAERTGAFYYGDGGTIHSTGHLDVETMNGEVVAVWFRCLRLPFQQVTVDEQRARDMRSAPVTDILTGVEIKERQEHADSNQE